MTAMEKQGMKCQVALSAFLLAVLIGSIFFPVFRMTGEGYITSAVKANIYAEKTDADAAKMAGTRKVIDSCRENTKSRKRQAEEFDQKIQKRTDRISGLRFIQWGLSAEKELIFPGIAYISKSDMEKSGANKVSRMIAMLLLLPILLAMANLIFMLVRRKSYPIWLGATGLVEIVFQILFWRLAPRMIWIKLAAYIKSFPLINEETMQIPGTGKYAVQSMMSEFMSTEFYVGMAAGTGLLLLSILFMTVCRPTKKWREGWVSRVWELVIAITICLACMGGLFSYLFWGYGAFEKADGKEAAAALLDYEAATPSPEDILKDKVYNCNIGQAKGQQDDTTKKNYEGISMIRGRVCDEENAPLSGVKVKLYSKTYGCRLYTGTTDTGGYYEIFVPAAEEKYEIIFSVRNKDYEEKMYHIDLGQKDLRLDEGTVYLVKNTSVRNYVVWLQDSTKNTENKVSGLDNTELIFRRGVNNYDGKVRLSMYTNGTGCADVSLEPGMYTVEANKSGYKQKYQNIFFGLNSDREVQILLIPRRGNSY